MKQHIIKLLTAIVIAVSFVACSNNQNGTNAHEGHDHSSGHHGMMEQTASTKEVADNVCPVSGEELGSMGEPIKATHEGHTVNLCCKDCVKEFKSNPTKYLADLTSDTDHSTHTHEANSEHH